MVFEDVMKVGDALLLPFGEVNRCIVQLEIRIVQDGGESTRCWGCFGDFVGFPPDCQSCGYCDVMIKIHVFD